VCSGFHTPHITHITIIYLFNIYFVRVKWELQLKLGCRKKTIGWRKKPLYGSAKLDFYIGKMSSLWENNVEWHCVIIPYLAIFIITICYLSKFLSCFVMNESLQMMSYVLINDKSKIPKRLKKKHGTWEALPATKI